MKCGEVHKILESIVNETPVEIEETDRKYLLERGLITYFSEEHYNALSAEAKKLEEEEAKLK